MNATELRRWCVSMPGAVETFPFEPNISVFKTEKNDKVFAITALDGHPLEVSVKCDPDRADMLRTTYESIVPGYHLNKRHWITVTVGSDASDALVKTLIEDSYDLVKPKA